MCVFRRTRVCSGFILATIVVLIGLSPNLYAQSPLTVQPSTGRVGVGKTNPGEPLDVNGNIKNSGSLSVGTTAQNGTANRFRFLNSMASASQATAQTGMAVNTWTTLNLATEDFDTDALHSTTTNNSRITVGLTGKYLVIVGGAINSTGATSAVQSAVRVIVNGSTAIAYAQNATAPGPFVAGGSSVLIGMQVLSLSAGSYIEGQAILVASSGTWSTFTSGTFLQAVYLGE